ncbi:hypothetical protein [Pseudomonas chlororaphis]|uniref:hypothetical protein n=1 Tax=Pseudomonas chlororaphis TaxID=587753 RepID=UPI000AC6DDAF|nr:hypothetical protein [Pseudomonas chlororaphis]QFS55650.1 hypothetical protein FD951_14220 [Pseudomonas chlororaphis subsp. aurantiaca]
MIANQETAGIESPESKLPGKGISINDRVRHLANLLLEFIQNGKLKNIPNKKLQEMDSRDAA